MKTAPQVKIGVGEVQISAQARANVLSALDDNRLSYGRWSREFERRFAALHQRKFACFVNSGTDALRIGLAAMKEYYRWKDGEVVLVPALTFVASYNTVRQAGLTPVLVDIDPDYYGMDFENAVRHFRGNTVVALMPVHLFGQPVPVPPIFRKHRLITDSCETMFVEGCADGDVSCFSTYACHLINTGVGGLATTNDPVLAMLIRSLANHGRDGIYTGIDQELGSTETIAARFRFERMGYSSRATELEAAIGCAELDVYEQSLQARRVNARVITEALCDLPLVLPKVRPGGDHAFMMYPVRARSRQERDALVLHLEEDGIETRPMLPLTNQPYMRSFSVHEDDYPVAKMVNETGLYVGCHPYLSALDIERIITSFRSFFA